MKPSLDGAGRTALITGASAGIGEALAHVFAGHGFDLILTARRMDRLHALSAMLKAKHGIEARTFYADLAQADGGAKLVSDIHDHGLTVDALVNNAGFAVPGNYRDTSWEVQRDFLQVLVTAPCELTHRLLPGMHARGYGRILNVASVAGLLPGSASHTLYGGAKAMMIKWSQSVHSEEKGSGVHVTALCPGFTLTEFHDISGTRAAMERLPRFMWLGAERVAQDGFRAVMKNEAICVPGRQYKAIAALVRFLPRGTSHRLGEWRSHILDNRR